MSFSTFSILKTKKFLYQIEAFIWTVQICNNIQGVPELTVHLPLSRKSTDPINGAPMDSEPQICSKKRLKTYHTRTENHSRRFSVALREDYVQRLARMGKWCIITGHPSKHWPCPVLLGFGYWSWRLLDWRLRCPHKVILVVSKITVPLRSQLCDY